jgi:ribosomal protein L40E
MDGHATRLVRDGETLSHDPPPDDARETPSGIDTYPPQTAPLSSDQERFLSTIEAAPQPTVIPPHAPHRRQLDDGTSRIEESRPNEGPAVCLRCGAAVEHDSERCLRCWDTDLAVPYADAPIALGLINHNAEPSPIRTTASSATAWFTVFSIFGIALVVAGIVCLFIHGNQVHTDNLNNEVNRSVASYENQNPILCDGPCKSPQTSVATITHPSSLILTLGWIGVGGGGFVLFLVLTFALVRRST